MPDGKYSLTCITILTVIENLTVMWVISLYMGRLQNRCFIAIHVTVHSMTMLRSTTGETWGHSIYLKKLQSTPVNMKFAVTRETFKQSELRIKQKTWEGMFFGCEMKQKRRVYTKRNLSPQQIIFLEIAPLKASSVSMHGVSFVLFSRVTHSEEKSSPCIGSTQVAICC